MLRPLLLLVFFLGAGALAFRWLRRSLPTLRGGPRLLDAAELKALRRQATSGSPLDRALEIRRKIKEVLGSRSDAPRMLAPVDTALGRLEAQSKLHRRIQDALAADRRQPAPIDEPVAAFEEREVMLGRLAEQARALEREQERIVAELSSLHLSLLDISATEAVGGTSASLSEALSDLEREGQTARRHKEAEAEVERFLAARKQST